MAKLPNQPKLLLLVLLLNQAQFKKNQLKHKPNKQIWDNREKIKMKNQSLKVQNIKMFKRNQRPRSQRVMQAQ